MARLTPAAARRLLEQRRQAAKLPWDVTVALSPAQLAIHRDATQHRVIEGTRQSSKSFLAACEMVGTGLAFQGTDSAFLDFDIEHADKVLLKDIAYLLEKFRVAATIVNGLLQFENGSKGYIFSGRPSEVKKLQGMKLKLLWADESNDAEALADILEYVRPALIRHNGRIVMSGIPGRVAKLGYWWRVTHGDLAHLFGQHRLTFEDNPWLDREALERERETARLEHGEESPYFQRHWKGQWPTTANDRRVWHAFDPALHCYEGEPPDCPRRSMGLDPAGVRDREAALILGHGRTDGHIYHLAEAVSAKKQGGGWDRTGERIKPLIDLYSPGAKFYDPGSARKGAQAIILQRDQHVLFEMVPSKDRFAEAERINRLFAAGRLWVRKDSELARDLLYTEWDEKSLAAGKVNPEYSSLWHPDVGDALRCAMWGLSTFEKEPPKVLTPAEVEAEVMRQSLRKASGPHGPDKRAPNPYAARRNQNPFEVIPND